MLLPPTHRFLIGICTNLSADFGLADGSARPTSFPASVEDANQVLRTVSDFTNLLVQLNAGENIHVMGALFQSDNGSATVQANESELI